MSGILKLLRIGITIAVIVICIVSITRADTIITVLSPSSPVEDISDVKVPPLLDPPPGAVSYTEIPLTEKINTGGKFAVAQLANPQLFAESARAYLIGDGVAEPPVPDGLSFQILASVIYEKADTPPLLVTTSRPSSQALDTPLLLGDTEVDLPLGIPGWTTTNQPGAYANKVVFSYGDSVVTVASNQSIDVLVPLTAQIIIE